MYNNAISKALILHCSLWRWILY